MRSTCLKCDHLLSSPNSVYCTFCQPMLDRCPTRDHLVTADRAVFHCREHCTYRILCLQCPTFEGLNIFYLVILLCIVTLNVEWVPQLFEQLEFFHVNKSRKIECCGKKMHQIVHQNIMGGEIHYFFPSVK